MWSLRAFAPLRGRWELDIYGVGQRAWLRWAEKRLIRYGLEDQVRLHPPLERGRLERELGHYHAGLAPLLKTERNAEQGCCPVKIMDYLAHGLVTVAPDLAAVRAMLQHQRNSVLYTPNSLQASAAPWRNCTGAAPNCPPCGAPCGTRSTISPAGTNAAGGCW
ncbi:glycosyltransferase family 4 protein, partial [Methylogaea oryzae]|uniref:glycosyltransferase family 4 protein n=1 Tax=Methylogaea oryzae TaxID=1295382 RepID=UPI00138F7FA2